MNTLASDISGILAIQHRVMKDLRKKNGLRQRDWEMLFACYRLLPLNYPFTASKIDAYLYGAYFLPSLYNSIRALLEKDYITIVVPGKPFRPESYQMTYKGMALVRECTKRIRSLFEEQDHKIAGKTCARVW